MAQLDQSPSVILLAEDEPVLRLHACDILERAGFTVIEVWNADQAIEILERRSDIVAVFTDIDMPGSIDGLRLAAAIRNRWPPVEIILTSGKVVPQSNLLPARARFLPKPYSERRLVEVIRDALQPAG
jgi:CheY-like chemotaxis protein